MSRSRLAAGVAVLALIGLWGCSQSPTDTGSSADKLKAVESKLARLEDDFRSAASARDQMAKRLSAVEEARGALQIRVDLLTRQLKEKDDLIQQRTTERDQVTGQYKAFRDGLRELLAKAEEGAKPDGSQSAPVIPTAISKPGEVPAIPIPAGPSR
jgi:septal ring factor EnvC (AmiA/AmiB activator)